jgi:3-dehydroquinate synthase
VDSRPQHTVRVNLDERSYDIIINDHALHQAGALISDHVGTGPVLVICDGAVERIYGSPLISSLERAGINARLVSFPPGEPSKTLATCERLWQACADHAIDRSGTIIALGGGVTGDMAGFVAATWMRGIRFIQIPTTLLAMVDSSVGGKTGVNSSAGKNLIGAFQQPSLVLIDPTVLASMDDREYRAGLAEVAKYGVIKDPDFFTWQEANHQALVQRDTNAIAEAVATSCRIKAWFVENDEREQGQRAHLNYGHTFGHAIERDTGYRQFLHGEAVAIGMEMAVDLARRLGLLEQDDLAARQQALLTAYGLPIEHRCSDRDAALSRMVRSCSLDKKVRGGQTRFVLPRSLGVIEIVTAPDPDLVRAAFAAAMP